MRNIIALTLLAGLFMTSCTEQTGKTKGENPLMSEFNTPFNVPPFEQIQPEHYMPWKYMCWQEM